MTSHLPLCHLGLEVPLADRERTVDCSLDVIHAAELKQVDSDLRRERFNIESANAELKPDAVCSSDTNCSHPDFAPCNYVADDNIWTTVFDRTTSGRAGTGFDETAEASPRSKECWDDEGKCYDRGSGKGISGNVPCRVSGQLTPPFHPSADDVIRECQVYLLRVRNDVTTEHISDVISREVVVDDDSKISHESKTGRHTGNNSDDKRNNSDDKGNNSDDKGNNSDDKGNNSDYKGNNSHYKGNNSGDKGNNSDDKGNNSDDKGNNSDDRCLRQSQRDPLTRFTLDSNSTFNRNQTNTLCSHIEGRDELHSVVLKQNRLTSNGVSPLTDLSTLKPLNLANNTRDTEIPNEGKLPICSTQNSVEFPSDFKRLHRQTYPLSLFRRWENIFHSVFIKKHQSKVHQEINEIIYCFGSEDEESLMHLSHSDSDIVDNQCRQMDGTDIPDDRCRQMDGAHMNSHSAHLTSAATKSALSELSPMKTSRSPSHIRSNILYETTNKKAAKFDVEKQNGIGIEANFTARKLEVDRNVETLKTSASFTHRVLNFALAYLWVGPLVSVYWCNSWHIPENYLLPADPEVSSWISGAIGYTIYFLGYLLQDVLASFAVRQRKAVQWVIMQLYTYVMCWGNVNQWRCVWVLLDVYTGAHLLNAALSCALASAALILMRAHRVTAAAPSTVRMDLPVDDHFKMRTYFEVETGKWSKVADCLFTVFVVDTVGVVLWRGLWEVIDFTLVPEDKTMSGVWTLVISYSLAILLFLTQDLVRQASICIEDRHWIVSLALEDLITILHSTVTICHWRGFWTLLDVYMPYKPVSHWIGHLVSFVLLAVGMAATSIPVLGLVRDGQVVKGEGIVFDHYYFTHLYELWILRKSTHHMNDKEECQSTDELSTMTVTTIDSLPY